MTRRWIFGYGSLVWRPAFPYAQRRAAWIRGFTRRFWQGSPDHRGLPGAPGRVVTLVAEPDTVCWGAAYQIETEREDDILDALDLRERGGYERHELDLHFQDGGPGDGRARGLVYLATASNPNYLGPAPLHEIAQQVLRSRGPSGTNLEYVMRLAEALREMSAEDEDVFALERLLVGSP